MLVPLDPLALGAVIPGTRPRRALATVAGSISASATARTVVPTLSCPHRMGIDDFPRRAGGVYGLAATA